MARRTQKQRQIMDIIFGAVDRGQLMNVTEIHAALPYACSYGALRISLRFLKEHDLVTYETAGGQNFYKPTAKAYAWFRPGS
jgi:predicted transcriptional regulator